jgi:predicted AAA+ superfamily ATPase
MSGFGLAEVGMDAMPQHWLRGGFPLSLLASDDAGSLAWRRHFVQTFLERDLPQWGVRVPSATLLRFWTMLAHYHGQIWNAAEPARVLGVSQPTVRRYVDVLEGVYMIRVLQPWHANLKKRQVKSPKVYFRDSGLLHYLLGIRTEWDLHSHPRSGASWEGYAIEETLKAIVPDEAYFWATHGGAELDLLLLKDGRRLGVECKYVDAPRVTPSLQNAMQDLKLDQLTVVYPGERAYPLADRIEVIPLSSLAGRE